MTKTREEYSEELRSFGDELVATITKNGWGIESTVIHIDTGAVKRTEVMMRKRKTQEETPDEETDSVTE